MRPSLLRKLAYLMSALVLFAAMLPLRRTVEDLRGDIGLSEATLGDVDPTSSTMVLVLGGFRGVAVNVLWSRLHELQKKHDWYAFEPVVESVIKLQPHFVQVWTYQGWNLAYNISQEWDQVEDKYYWIKDGIQFLQRGTRVNENSPELRWDVGWTYHHKLGRADEATLLRRLFRYDINPEIDPSGHELPPFNPFKRVNREGQEEGQDNHEAALDWFVMAVEKLDTLNVKPKRMGEVAFRASPAHAQTAFAKAREEEGQFGEVIQADWLEAYSQWRRFADHEYSTVDEGKAVKVEYPPEIFTAMYISMGLYQRAEMLNQAAALDWESANPRDLLRFARAAWPEHQIQDIEKLTAAERGQLKKAWAEQLWSWIQEYTPRLLRDFNDGVFQMLRVGDGPNADAPARQALEAVRAAWGKLQTADVSRVAEQGPDADALRKQLAEYAAAIGKLGAENGLASEELYWSDRYSTMVNYRYWRDLAIAESQPETVSAREHFYKGLEKFREGTPVVALAEFEAGLEIWKRVLEKYSRVRDDDLTVEDTVKIVRTYLAVRDQNDLPPLEPDDVPFADFIKRLTPDMPTPEQMQQMQAMQKRMMEAQKSGANMEELKREMMEQFKGAQPPGQPTQPPPAQP
jgi:hypothetical protein